MASSISGKLFDETLRERLSADASILKDSGNILAFAACVFSGAPLSLAVLGPLILKTAGSAISSSMTILKAFANQSTRLSKAFPKSRERFRLLFYLYVQQAYLEALKDSLEDLDITEMAGGKDYIKKLKKDDFTRYKETIEPLIDQVQEAEVYYSFCIDPTEKNIPLLHAYKRWLAISLETHGAEAHKSRELANKIEKEARKRLREKLASDEKNPKWIREYLVLEYLEDIPKISSDLTSIRLSLDEWTDPLKDIKDKQKKAWGRYRDILMGLPDDKETMYNESFGVREVFVAPQVKYHVAGAKKDSGEPQDIPDISKLFGALASNRISGDDLIILCGGPGSGKSTLCKMLASELARNENVHPVFLKLRRCNEGLDICSFVAENLCNAGIIHEVSELHDVPNLILILDGFDELVMASRQRLRIFFNHLQDDLRTGPFRNAKAIISGRDTLFPNGQGLPHFSHILSLVPFEKNRVRYWGKKWQKRNKGGLGETFRPEVFFEDDEDKAKQSALHHLVAWPLTLHLVAQVHAAGHLDTTEKSKRSIKKSYLYRSILAETARRQEEKRPGAGRLDKEGIRNFLRSLAYAMYIRSVDSFDIDDAIPIIEQFFPEASKEELQDLSDTNVLNAPEIQKKEETGFEFVHKSFSEYLVAEKFASIFEDVCYKVPDRLTKKQVWHMSSEDVTKSLSAILGIRLLPAEVQEMLEPILGCYDVFLKKVHVRDIVPTAKRIDGLSRIIQRFGEVYSDMLKGTALRGAQDTTAGKLLIESPLEAYANYAAGIAIVGTAAARQLKILRKTKNGIFFQGNPFEGAFWRFIWILQAGGITLDDNTSSRIYSGMTVRNEISEVAVGDWSIPLNLSALTEVDGYQADLLESVRKFANSYFLSLLISSLERHFLPIKEKDLPIESYRSHKDDVFIFKDLGRHYREPRFRIDHYRFLEIFIGKLVEARMLPKNSISISDKRVYRDLMRYFERASHELNLGKISRERIKDYYEEIHHAFRHLDREIHYRGELVEEDLFEMLKFIEQRLISSKK